MVQVNVGNIERTASVILGSLALTQAFRGGRGRVSRTAAGSTGMALLWRGLSGNCPVYSGLDISSHRDSPKKPQTWIERSALVNRSIEEVKTFLDSGDKSYGPIVSTAENIYEIKIDDRLWLLNLSKHADGERTLIRMSWDDKNQGQTLSQKIQAVGKFTPRILELRKLKALLEIGEIATVEGQSHGERSRLGELLENFGDSVIEKIQSQLALPEEPHINKDFPFHRTYLREAKV